MAQSEEKIAKQLGRGKLAQVLTKPGVTPEEQTMALQKQGLGEAKRQLSPQGQLGGAVGRGRALKPLGTTPPLGRTVSGGGLGNRSLGRFRRPQ